MWKKIIDKKKIKAEIGKSVVFALITVSLSCSIVVKNFQVFVTAKFIKNVILFDYLKYKISYKTYLKYKI